MSRVPGSAALPRRLAYRWFIQYNPLFFFSALCVLAGVLLISRSLPDPGMERSRLLLAGVVQLYELLLIGAAALLLRAAGQRRPAVILGIMEIPFLFDWTFQTEAFSALGDLAALATSLWILLVPMKLWLLARTFRLRVPSLILAATTAAAAVLAILPQLMNAPAVDPGRVHLGSIWIGAFLAAVALRVRARILSFEALDSWGQVVLRRACVAAAATWAGLYLLHAGAWLLQFDLAPGPLHVVPLLLLSSFLYRHEVVAWLAASAALAVSALVPAAVAPTAAVIGGVLLLQAWDLSRERLYVGGVLAFHVAFWTTGWEAWPLPGSFLAPSLITAAVLLLLWYRLRLKTALVATGLVLLPHARNWIPASTLQWGISVVALGFLALILGVAINWRLRHAGQPPNPGV